MDRDYNIGEGYDPQQMVLKAFYDEKMEVICQSLLKDIFSNNNPGCPDIWYVCYAFLTRKEGRMSHDLETLSYAITDVPNLSYNKLVNEVLPDVKKRVPTFLGFITKQYTLEYYKKICGLH